jgi:uncharacterized protein YecT (DUF1311 family)
MKSYFMYSVLLIVSGCSGAYKQQAAMKESDCNNPMGPVQISGCVAERLQIADDALNQQWTQTLKAIRTLDQKREVSKRPLEDALMASQQAWINFRDKTCLLETSLDENHPELTSDLCRANVTRARTEQLKYYIEGL